MAFERMEFRKRTYYPELGTEDFRKGMQISLEAYDSALDYLIAAMEHIRESFREMIDLQIGLEQYEEYLKENRAAERAKEMRPDAVERMSISDQEQEEDQRMQREVKDAPARHGEKEEQQDQVFLQTPQGEMDNGYEEQKEVQGILKDEKHLVKQDPEEYWKGQMEDIYDPDLVQELEGLSQQQEKRRGR